MNDIFFSVYRSILSHQPRKQIKVSIIFDKIHHKLKLVRNDKEDILIVIKGITYQMESLLLNVYIPKILYTAS